MTTHFMAHRFHHLELINKADLYCQTCDLFIDPDSVQASTSPRLDSESHPWLQRRYRLVVQPIDVELQFQNGDDQ